MANTQNLPVSVASYIQKLVPYVPGKPIEETQREKGLKRVVKLASNENPLGPSPMAVKAVSKGLADLHRYPDASGFRLKNALAPILGVGPDSIVLGNGSNDVIDLLLRAFCVPGDRMVTHDTAFVAYQVCATVQGVETVSTPVDSKTLKPDVDAIVAAAAKDPRAKIVFIANPNNPTGVYLNQKEMKRLVQGIAKVREGSVLLVLDSAYHEYVTAPDFPNPFEFFKSHSNVVILRTFSKIYGLAGVRLGYGVMHPRVASILEKIRQPFNLNDLALRAGEAALKDTAFVRRAVRVNEKGKNFWKKELTKHGVPFWESQGNFLLVDVSLGGKSAKTGKQVFEAALDRGVIFRPVTNYGLPQALRISIGTDEENRFGAKVLWEVL